MAQIVLILLFLSVNVSALENGLLSHQIKRLLADPSENSSLVYEIPLEVTLLDISPNADWYKVKISFYVGPFNYVYTGWTKIPIGTDLTKRNLEAAEKLSSYKK